MSCQNKKRLTRQELSELIRQYYCHTFLTAILNIA